MTYVEALDSLPPDAKWSCCFGYHGEPGCNEYFRTKDGRRFVISNEQQWWFRGPFTWTVREVH